MAKEYDHTGQPYIYPLQNPVKKGYGVREPDVNPANKSPNGRMVNQANEKLDFWIEDVTANFGMTGKTAQSRNLRQFFPHNVVQPTITITGRAPNSFQLNRMASFVRASHWNAFHPRKLGSALRHDSINGKSVPVQTVRLIIRNRAGKEFPYDGKRQGHHQTVKGKHRPMVLEGYIKNMKAGGRKENHAPQFQFDFFIAESQFSRTPAIGIWEDTRVYGSELKPWLDWIKKDGEFVTVNDKRASQEAKSDQQAKKNEEFIQELIEDVVNPLF